MTGTRDESPTGLADGRRLVLASTSPYRRELLGRLGLPFSVTAPEVDETPRPAEAPEALALRLSAEKAHSVADEGRLVIGSDQVACLGGRRIGKPGDHEAAVEQLLAASGQTMVFFSGLSLHDGTTGRCERAVVRTDVRFRELERPLVEAYLRRERPYDCAGACKVEGLGITLLAEVRSEDPTALIGLPLIRLCDMLRRAGVEPLLAMRPSAGAAYPAGIRTTPPTEDHGRS